MSETNKSFTLFNSGSLQDWINNSVELPGLGKIPGKLFIKDLLGLTSSQISINAMAPGDSVPFYHSHKRNEEIYIFIHGRGQMQIDHETIDVSEGSIVRLSPRAVRTIRNNSDTPLVHIVAQMEENSLVQSGLEDGIASDEKVVWQD